MTEIVQNHKTTIVDVRTVEEFEMGHVEGSLNIPLHLVPLKIDEFRQMSKPIVVVCASGNRSGQAARFLESQGIEEIYNGGGWVDVLDMKAA